MSAGFNLKLPAALAPYKRLRLSFEWGIDFSLVMEVLGDILFQ